MNCSTEGKDNRICRFLPCFFLLYDNVSLFSTHCVGKEGSTRKENGMRGGKEDKRALEELKVIKKKAKKGDW